MSILRPQNVTFSAAGDPTQSIVGARVSDTYHNTTSGEVFRCKVDTFGSQEWVGDQGTTVPSAILATDHPDLLGMWTDNISGSTLLDDSPNNYDMTLLGTGGPTVVDSGTSLGNVIRFVRTGSQFARTTLVPQLTYFTYAFWVRPDNVPSGVKEYLFGQGGDNFFIHDHFTAAFRGSAVATDGTWKSTAPATAITDTVGYTCVIVVSDGVNLKTYYDGVEVGTVAFGEVQDEVGTIYTGFGGETSFASGGNYFDGDIGRVRLFNRALTADERSAIVGEGS